MDIVADIGGTRTRVACTDDTEQFGEPLILGTPQAYEEGVAAIGGAILALSDGRRILKAAIGVPGVLCGDKRVMHCAGNLSDWNLRPFADDLEKITGGKVFLMNDCAQAGLGEAVYGAGRGACIVVYMTVSTGVNAVRVVDGTLEPSLFGTEAGLQYLVVDGEPQMLNTLIAGCYLQHRFGIHPKLIDRYHPVWDELAHYTGFGVYNMIVHWSPHRVVLGGSMFNEIGISVSRVREHVHALMRELRFPLFPEIFRASLGDLGGLWGGLVVLRNNAST